MKSKSAMILFYQFVIAVGLLMLLVPAFTTCLCRLMDPPIVYAMRQDPDAWSLQIDESLDTPRDNPHEDGPEEIKADLLRALDRRYRTRDVAHSYAFAFGLTFIVLGLLGIVREKRMADVHRRLIAVTENRPADHKES
jgi:hypothetical protein